MKISTKGRYALAIMLDLAMNNPEEYISLKDIATRQEISIKYLEKIIAYKLARKPDEYKVGDILRTAEGDLAPTTCVQEGCHKQDSCLTYSFWQGLDNAIENYVDSKTLEDLIKNR